MIGAFRPLVASYTHTWEVMNRLQPSGSGFSRRLAPEQGPDQFINPLRQFCQSRLIIWVVVPILVWMMDSPLAGAVAGRCDDDDAQMRTRWRYRRNLARHLIGIARDLQTRVREALREESGYVDLRPGFGPFLALLWDADRPLGFLARELGISNQAMSQLADRAERAGYLIRRPNPGDGRSRIVALTARGRTLLADGIRAVKATETEYAALLGAPASRRFTEALADLHRGLGLPRRGDALLSRRAGGSVGTLPLLAERIQRDLMEATAARGHPGLKMSHGQVLPLIGPRGGRVGQIARIQRVSRQAISATARDLQQLGYLRRAPDPSDRRGVVFELTPEGRRLIEDSIAAVDDLEHRFDELLGRSLFQDLERVAFALYDALGLETEIFGSIRVLDTSKDLGDGDDGDRRTRREIEELAGRLRRWLGREDAARLGLELELELHSGREAKPT